jgi:hypothetical protein
MPGVRQSDSGVSVDQPKYLGERATHENEQQAFDLPDTICHNRYHHTGSDYGPDVDLRSYGKTRMV